MPDRTNATSTPAGVLRPEELAHHVRLERHPCGETIQPGRAQSEQIQHWVENYWTLRWNLPYGQRYTSAVLPHPACTLSVERGRPRPEVGDEPVVVTGVVTRRFQVTVSGSGWVLGVKFRPGGLAALTGSPARELTDRVVPAAGLLPEAVVSQLATLGPELPAEEWRCRADRALDALAREPDPSYETVLALIGDMLDDHGLVRVAELADRHGMRPRQLERLFARYVGVSPKWVLARYRMHDAVTEIDAGYEGTLADLAARYGWYDQAHFNRDFVALVGTTPGRYRR